MIVFLLIGLLLDLGSLYVGDFLVLWIGEVVVASLLVNLVLTCFGASIVSLPLTLVASQYW